MPLHVLASVVAFAAAHATPASTPKHTEPLPIPAGGSASRDSVPRARAVRAEHSPRIDGKDDDTVWRLAPVYGDFLEFEPHEGTPARFRTEFKVAYDDRNLYVFVRAYDPHPDSIMHALSRHDIRGPSDQLKIIIDAYHDRRSGFEFAVNPDDGTTTHASRRTRRPPGRALDLRSASCARTRCCAGNTARGRRCSSCGSTGGRTSPGRRTTGRGARSTTTCSGCIRTTPSW